MGVETMTAENGKLCLGLGCAYISCCPDHPGQGGCDQDMEFCCCHSGYNLFGAKKSENYKSNKVPQYWCAVPCCECCACGFKKPEHFWTGQANIFGCCYARAQVPPTQCGCNDGSYVGIWTEATPVIDKCVCGGCLLMGPPPVNMNDKVADGEKPADGSTDAPGAKSDGSV